MSEAVDNLNPVDYALTTTNVDNGLTDLGFKFHGVNTSDPKDERSIWHKNLGRGIRAIVVTSANTPTRLNFFKVRIKGRGVFADTKELERRENIGVNDLRRIVMRWQTEAREVIHRLLDAEDDALDPKATLDQHANTRCPHCGSSNVSHKEGEAITDCYSCGCWFQPDVYLPVQESLEDEIPDVKDYALRHGAKPFGYVLRSRVKGTGYPWMNTRWSDRSDCCGNFRRHLGDATVFKRQSTVKGYTGLDAVPVYSDPRKTGNRALSPYNVNEEHENPDDPENFIRDFIQRIPPLNPRICISFSQTTPESAEQGDYSDSGWIDEEGVEMTPDEFDQEEGLTAVDLAVKFLQNEGAMETSSSQFHPGVWYSTTWNTVNYHTGTDEERSFHLKDFSPAEEQEIWDKIHERWNRARRPH